MGHIEFHYGEDALTARHCWDLAQGKLRGDLSKGARARIAESSAGVAALLASKEALYGINTGFGPLCGKRISEADIQRLQRNLLLSHSVGVGASAPLDIVRLMLVTKAHALAQGYSGVREVVIERLLWHLKTGYLPRVPTQGSVGASGDLAPLAHLSLPLIGKGELWHKNRYVPTMKVLQKETLKPLTLQAKEGLALINGTQLMLSYAVWALWRSFYCLESADVIGAMALEAWMGSSTPFKDTLHALRPFSGVQYVAQRLNQLVEGSPLMKTHVDCDRVQDPYSFRCMPQVHGAARAAWKHLKEQTECELNSVTDNPILVRAKSQWRALSGGHFHGEPIALPMNYASLGIAELGSISERRSYALSKGDGHQLPPLLTPKPGLNSGLMIPQYTAAALVSENKGLAYPTAVDSIPTGGDQEDHVSMGAHGGRQLKKIVEHVEHILGIEMLYALQGLHLRRPLRSTPLLEACYAHARARIAPLQEDRELAPDIQTATDIVRKGDWLDLIKTQRGTIPLGHPFDKEYQL